MTSKYAKPLVWFGSWNNDQGLKLQGFHVWNKAGKWVGCYHTKTRAEVEARCAR